MKWLRRKKAPAAADRHDPARRWQQMALSDEDARLVEEALPQHHETPSKTNRDFLARLRRRAG